MNEALHYDYLFLGGGKGGKSLAMDLARAGKRVAVIERGMIGGSCINVACIPSKTLIQVARHLHARSLIDEESGSRTDMAQVSATVKTVVDGMVELNRRAFQDSGLHLVTGTGRFVGPRKILVQTADGSEQMFEGDHVYINTGTFATIPDVPGLPELQPLTHVEALRLTELPSHLVVLGGGYIGLEMAQAFRRLGSDVTVVNDGPRLLMREDEDVSAEILQSFQHDGIDVKLNVRPVEAQGRNGDGARIRLSDESVVQGTHVLVATGRTPATSTLDLHLAGVECDARGFIKVDDTLATTAERTWAIGEVAGTPMFTHASFDDYRVLKAGIEGRARSVRSRTIPYALFIDPELGRIGMNESQAKASNVPYRVAKLPLAAVPRARTNRATRGFMKALVSPESSAIIGFTMLGSGAGEVTTAVQMAMLSGLPYTAVRDAIIAHPLMSEGLNLLFATLK
ncbi:pyruvate/2-oxoglutarate dehydrogenase complex dihydrolipoamide dehydrogenase (E3) component [Paraburkholderia sp. BL6669N2]|uniref:FAD-dependent oxidoreductase n=1 Tax=Paraburkholderia sp. BL6669N2 TaxID=1938807 RepID=UPI000E22EEBF|nr:FAD-dependent oxidoreductase [Paraburkholderia sp. BL6669N2]REG49081.1 pyruvate/2-oxoglutarate dehydrogenase complex dihydrolipoamide dehydrogenase (E3) component [Paraburkholderia sp. BL6669N2]